MTREEFIKICGKMFIKSVNSELGVHPTIQIFGKGTANDFAHAYGNKVVFYLKEAKAADKNLVRWVYCHEARHVFQNKYLDKFSESNSVSHAREKLIEVLLKVEKEKNSDLGDKTLLNIVLDRYHDFLPEELDANIYAFLKTGKDFSEMFMRKNKDSIDNYIYYKEKSKK